MDKEEVIRMGIECGLGVEMEDYEDGVLWFDADPMPFAALVAAAERERCVCVVEGFADALRESGSRHEATSVEDAAEAIRDLE